MQITCLNFSMCHQNKSFSHSVGEQFDVLSLCVGQNGEALSLSTGRVLLGVGSICCGDYIRSGGNYLP